MSPIIDKLCGIGSQALCELAVDKNSALMARERGLYRLLCKKNGFFCFESALHVFHSGVAAINVPSLEGWNDLRGWRGDYGTIIPSQDVFFAQDIFGGQFFLREGVVWSFDPETAEIERVAADIEEWCAIILSDWRLLTGYSLAHEWQKVYGKLAVNKRLVPKVPFFSGGDYSVENLYAEDAEASMKFRAEIARQIVDLPDGSTIRLKVTDD